MFCRRIVLALIIAAGAAQFPARALGATSLAPPSGLFADHVTSTGALLCWTPSMGSVARYDIYVGQVVAGSTTETCVTISNLLPATVYTFTVGAFDAGGGSSPASNAIVVMTLATQDVSPPSAPGNLAWTADDGTVTLTWTASTDDVGVVAYDLYYGKFCIGAFSETRADILGFKEGVPYLFSVKARDAAGNVSVESYTVEVLLPPRPDTIPPTQPTNLTASSVTATSVKLSWAASTDDKRGMVYLISSGGTVFAVCYWGLSINVTGLLPGTSYSFAVTALDAASNASPASEPVSVTTLTTPDTTPPVLTVTAPMDGATVQSSTVTITGTAMDQELQEVTVQGVPVAVATDGSFQTTLSLRVGDNSVFVAAVDFEGNRSSTAILVTYVVVAPRLMVAMGAFHTVVVKADGTLWAWGANDAGQVGDGTKTDRLAPKQIGTGFAMAAAGYDSTFAIKTDGSLWGWGWDISDGVTPDSASPVQIGTDFAMVAARYGHALAVRLDGTLWAWGDNGCGQLGDGTTVSRYVPVQIGTGFAFAAVGAEHSMAIKTDGSLWTWGRNQFGELGDGTTDEHHFPEKVGDGFVVAAGGWQYTLAVKTDGTLWAWGNNWDGRLGDGTTTESHRAVLIGSGFATVAAGEACSLAVKRDGSLWAWGENQWGALGDGTNDGDWITSARHSPEQIATGFSSVAASWGNYSSAGTRISGSVWTWGNNEHGQLGDGTTVQRLLPTEIELR